MADRLDTALREIMTRDVATVDASQPLAEAVSTLLLLGVSGLPVIADRSAVVGVLSLADVAKKLRGEASEEEDGTVFYDSLRVEELLKSALAGGTPNGNVRDYMSPRVIALRPEATVREACRLMVEQRVHRILVTDERGMLVGIVSTLDVVDHVSA